MAPNLDTSNSDSNSDSDSDCDSFVDDENRWSLEVYYTNHGTKLFVENGVLVEETVERLPDPPLSAYMPDRASLKLMSSGTSNIPPREPTPVVDREAKRFKSNAMQAEDALEFYNRKHLTNYELVDPVEYIACMWNGKIWFHCNFTAKPKASSDTLSETSSDDSSAMLFFAELKHASVKSGKNYAVTACFPLNDIKTVKHCEMCGEGSIVHPIGGFRQGCQ